MKHRIFLVACLSALPFVVSGCAGCSETEHTEAVTADITAAQMEGRDAARRVLNEDWHDRSILRERLDSVKAWKERIVRDKNSQCGAAFDSTFISTLRAVRPELATAIEREKLAR